MQEVVSTIDSLLSEVQKKADGQLDLLLNKLLERVLYPPVARPSGTCAKHGPIKSMYVEIACLRTKYRSLCLKSFISEKQLDSIESKYTTAREAYRSAPCTCVVGKIKPHDECVCCGANMQKKNGCRHPIHLMYKKGELTETKPVEYKELSSNLGAIRREIRSKEATEAQAKKTKTWINGNTALAFDSGSGW